MSHKKATLTQMGAAPKDTRRRDRSASRSPPPRDRRSTAASSDDRRRDRSRDRKQAASPAPGDQQQPAQQQVAALNGPPPTTYPNGVDIPGIGTDVSLLQALSVNTKLSPEVLTQLIEALGSKAEDDANDFGFLTAARIIQSIKDLPDMRPMTAGKLLAQCRIVAETCGGDVWNSFQETNSDGIHIPQQPIQPAAAVTVFQRNPNAGNTKRSLNKEARGHKMNSKCSARNATSRSFPSTS
jgi:hypothetical protein